MSIYFYRKKNDRNNWSHGIAPIHINNRNYLQKEDELKSPRIYHISDEPNTSVLAGKLLI